MKSWFATDPATCEIDATGWSVAAATALTT